MAGTTRNGGAPSADARAGQRREGTSALLIIVGRVAGFKGHSQSAYDIFSRPAAAAVVAWLGLLLGIIVSIWGADVRTATRAFFEALRTGETRKAHLLAIFFWTGLVTWARLLYLQLTVDDERRRRRIEALDRTVFDLKGTIFRAPNPAVYERVKEYFERTVDLLAKLESAAAAKPSTPELRRVLRERQVAAILEAMVRCARAFSLRSEEVAYRANVMLMEECRPKESPPFPEPLLRRLKFFDTDHFAESKLLGLLYIPSVLAYPARAQPTPGAPIHDLVLPVPRKTLSGAVRRALPGAPSAFLTGEMSVHEDTRRIAVEWPDLDPRVREQIEAHFEDGGGAHLRSFASLRIGNKSRPLGVVNIDAPETHLLGPSGCTTLPFTRS